MLFIGVAILVVGHQLWLRARGWQFNALSPYFMCDLLIFALIGLGTVVSPLPHRNFTEELLFSLFVWSGLAAYYLGLHLRLRLPALRLPRLGLSLQWLQRRIGLLALLLASGFALIIALTLYQRVRGLGLSLSEMLTLSALQVHAQVATEGLGALPVIITYLLTVLLLMHLYFLLQHRQYLTAFGVYLLMNVSILLIASTRIPVIMNLAIPIAYYHYAVRRINKLLLIGIFIVAPVAITLLQGLRSGALFAWTVSDRLIAEIVVMKSFHRLWQEYTDGNIALEYGANYYYYSPLTFVPKALWADKPQTSFETRWTLNLFNSLLDEDAQISVHTFTPWGEGLAQFGWLGGVMNLFLYGVILNWAIQFFNRRPHACLVYFFYTILAATFIRTGVQALFFTTFLYVLGVWLYERWFLFRTAQEGRLAACVSS
ncbi:MAG: oligosaccharide repeat unit polymerase [Fimbriimonadales bacterium]|nr:oligosaccharide repeat unit polymerase [Fimbriimonadales bacterium]